MFSYSDAPLTDNEKTINEHFKKFDIVKLMLIKVNNFATFVDECTKDSSLVSLYKASEEDLAWIRDKTAKLNQNAQEKPVMVINMFAQFLVFYDDKKKEFDREKFESAYPTLVQTIKMMHAQQNPDAAELFFPDLNKVPSAIMDKIYRYASFFCDITTQIIANQKPK